MHKNIIVNITKPIPIIVLALIDANKVSKKPAIKENPIAQIGNIIGNKIPNKIIIRIIPKRVLIKFHIIFSVFVCITNIQKFYKNKKYFSFICCHQIHAEHFSFVLKEFYLHLSLQLL